MDFIFQSNEKKERKKERKIEKNETRKEMRMWIKVILLAVSAAVVVYSADAAGEGADRDMMRNAMEHLLQIRPPVSSSRSKRQDDDDSTTSSPHLYMMELYKKYLTSDSMKTRSNTIRSIIPLRGTTHHSLFLFFFFFFFFVL